MNNKTKRMTHLLSTGLLLAGLSLTHSTQPVMAMTRPADAENASGIEFKLSEAGGVYTVYMRPNITPGSPNATTSGQVTVKVPHGAAAPSELASLVTGTSWEQTSRYDAPAEAPTWDYVSFSLDFPSGDFRAFNWAAGTAVPVLSFKAGAGGHLMDSCDAFAAPNSASAAVGNEISVLGLSAAGNEGKSVFVGNYDQTTDCPTQANAVSAVSVTARSSASTVQGGGLIVYTFNISNTGLRTAENLSLKVSLTGLADMQSASNSFDAANPVLAANGTATWQLGKLLPNEKGSVTLSMIAPKSNDTLTTDVSIAATNDNSANDNDARVVVVVQTSPPTQPNRNVFLPTITR